MWRQRRRRHIVDRGKDRKGQEGSREARNRDSEKKAREIQKDWDSQSEKGTERQKGKEKQSSEGHRSA